MALLENMSLRERNLWCELLIVHLLLICLIVASSVKSVLQLISYRRGY